MSESLRKKWLSDIRRMVPRNQSAWARMLAILGSQGIWAVTMFRFGSWLNGLPRPVRLGVSILYRPLAKLVQCATGIDIPSSVVAGPGLYIGHFGCIFIHNQAIIGENVNLSQGVTIGVSGFGSRRGVPKIGDRVYVGPGAKIFGPITIGSDCIIGANAVVNCDVPDHSIVAGVPARVIRGATTAEIQEVIFGSSPDGESG